MSYIDREKLKMQICADMFGSLNFRDYSRLSAIIDGQKAEDVAPIKHGYWQYEDVDIVCSVCGGDGVMPWNKSTQHKFPYCPHCGARMQSEVNND